MATPNVQINPMQTTNGFGLFPLTSGGYIQGWQEPDPAARFALRQGILSASASQVMIPGAAISVATNPNSGTTGNFQGAGSLGNVINYATTAAGIRGFSVFNQAYGGIITPTASVPVMGNGQSINYLLLGSGARVNVGISATLASTFAAGADISTPVSWDFTSQELVPYVAAYTAQTITAASWTSGTATYTMAAVPSGIAVGSQVSFAGFTPSGYNGDYTVTAVTGTTISVAIAVNPGTATVLGTLAAGGGAVNVQILNVNIGNSLQVYADSNGLYQWNSTGSCALIKI